MDIDLASAILPLRTLDPADGDVADLAPIVSVIGDNRIACIGESTHGNHEFYLLKARLFRHLASEHGFTAFALESGFPEGWRVNDWVHGGPGDLDELSRNAITYGLGDCEEMRDLLGWMRDWNSTQARKLSFYGLDLGGGSSNPGSSIAAALARLSTRDGDAELVARTQLGGQHLALARWLSMDAAQRAQQADAAGMVLQRAIEAGDDRAHFAARSAHVIGEMMTFAATGEHRPGENPRDAYMADVLEWILQREAKVLVAAHNAHIQRTGLAGLPMLGSFLAEPRFPSATVIGATGAHGPVMGFEMAGQRITGVSVVQLQPPADGLETRMSQAGWPLAFLDLRRLSPGSLPPMPVMVQGAGYPTDVAQSFDAVVHIDQLTVIDPMIDRLAAELAEARRFYSASAA